MYQWPKDNEAALIAFYGTPGPEVERQLVKVIPPFQMFYDKKPLKYLLFHKKAAPALSAALNDIWQYVGRDQGKLDHDGVSSTAGTYCCRKIRGSDRWSNHAFGGAIDLDAEHNGFFAGKGTIPQYVIDAFDRVGFRWGGNYKGRTDPMHFEACDDGRPRPVALLDMPTAPDDSFEAYAGEAHTNGVGFADLGGAQEDEAAVRNPEADGARAGGDDKSSPGFFGRVRNWVTGGLSTLGVGSVGALTDWQIAALLLGFVLLCVVGGFLVALWLFGKQRVADWVSRHVA